MQYEFFIGKRYLFSRHKDSSISVITYISIFGVALGVAALIVSTSVMNGFRENLRKAIIGSLPHIAVQDWEGGMTNPEKVEEIVNQIPEVLATAPYIFKQALLVGKKRPKGTLVRGINIDREIKVTEIASFLREEIYGFPPSTMKEQLELSKSILERMSLSHSRKRNVGSDREMTGIILGASLALNLEVSLGDVVKVISSEERMTPVGDIPRMKKFEVVGIFESGISGYDEVLSFMDIKMLQKLYKMHNKVSGVGIRITDPELAPSIARELSEKIPEYYISNWADENKSLFQVMKLEKIGLFLILALIVVVAAFNIISSLVMLVLEKSRDIGILKSLGATDQSIRFIFMIQGLVIGTIGTISGLIFGLGICWIIQTFNIIDIPPGVYPGGNRIPVSINWPDVGITALCAFVICFIVTVYPATRAAKLDPVESLRYE